MISSGDFTQIPPVVFVTGVSGFIGSALFRSLKNSPKYQVRGSVRSLNTVDMAADLCRGNLTPEFDWSQCLVGIDTVIHTAANNLVPHKVGANYCDEFRKINVAGTMNLARQAMSAGVRRFIFLSSIKVHGESTDGGSAFVEDSPLSPKDLYAICKCEVENGLRDLAKSGDIEIVIIRPPLVYGPYVKGNLASLADLARWRLPLPFASIKNSRSLLNVDNLSSFIATCIEHPAAANQAFVVADGEDLSTPQLLATIGRSLGTSAMLFPFPPAGIKKSAALFGQQDLAQKLLGSLQVDIGKSYKLLGWVPKRSVEDCIQSCATTISNNYATVDGLLLRFFDIVISVLGLVLCLPLFVLIVLFGFFDTGSPLFRQERVGRYCEPFSIFKLRTMRVGTVSVASHLASTESLTKFGRFLRKTKLDELPQLCNVIKGEMSLVGPRPCLFNQEQLIELRLLNNIFAVRPGITGLAQIHAIDMSTPKLLVETELRMLETMSVNHYFRYILLTVFGGGRGDGVRDS